MAATGISVSAGSVRAVVAALQRLSGAELAKARRRTLEESGAVLHRAVVRNVSLRDHSLQDLARLDHPYARRHGSIRIHQSKPYQVHTQSGQLLSSLRAEVSPDGGAYLVWLDPTIAPHALHVVLGTRVMLPRDVLWETAEEAGVRKAIMRAIVRVLGKELRTQAGVRFGRAGRGAAPLGV